MDSTGIRRAVCIVSILGWTVATAGQQRDLRTRLTPAEVDAVETEVAGAGTSGLPAVTTRVLFGDPTKPGLYTIELRIAPSTTIQAHTHRDTRTAVVLDGVWYFGYGPRNEPSLEKDWSAAASTQNRLDNRILQGQAQKGRRLRLPDMVRRTRCTRSSSTSASTSSPCVTRTMYATFVRGGREVVSA